MATRRLATMVAAVMLTACGGPTGCADVIDVEARPAEDGTWRFDVTVSSADTGWDKYADKWVVQTLDGTLLGERGLAHPHENEQPFTRSLDGVIVPDEISTVEVAARDSVEGFCGETVVIDLS